MRKLFVMSAIFLFALAGKTFAKTGNIIAIGSPDTTKPKPSGDKPKDIAMELPSWSFGMSNTGAQTVRLPDGRGILKFTKTGDRLSNVVFTDAAGKVHNLQPSRPGTNGAPQPSCKYPLPDACFSTQDKNIGLCMCKPADITNHPDGYVIAMLLPAIQKVREAAQN